METEGDTRGAWDTERVRQLLGNLLSNAVKYGDRVSPIAVRLVGRTDDVNLALNRIASSGPRNSWPSTPRKTLRQRSTSRVKWSTDGPAVPTS